MFCIMTVSWIDYIYTNVIQDILLDSNKRHRLALFVKYSLTAKRANHAQRHSCHIN